MFVLLSYFWTELCSIVDSFPAFASRDEIFYEGRDKSELAEVYSSYISELFSRNRGLCIGALIMEPGKIIGFIFPISFLVIYILWPMIEFCSCCWKKFGGRMRWLSWNMKQYWGRKNRSDCRKFGLEWSWYSEIQDLYQNHINSILKYGETIWNKLATNEQKLTTLYKTTP